MRLQVKQAWLQALRSGEYKKVSGKLKGSGDGEFCLLGVLCDLYVKHTPGVKWDGGRIFGESGALPPRVREWAGLKGGDPKVSIPGGSSTSVAGLNDGNSKSFEELADLIEVGLD